MTEPVELTDAEHKLIATLAAQAGAQAPAVVEAIRDVARKEIASLCGFILRRLQDEHLTRSPIRNETEAIIQARLSAIFGEALADFSGHTASGSEPGGS